MLQEHIERGPKMSPFAFWVRTGRRVPAQMADPALEVKFNPYHDPANGQFTFGPGGAGGESAGMARRPKQLRRGTTWGGSTFTGGGGGSGGGGGASGSGFWMNQAEIRAFRRRYPDREPHMVDSGETLDQIAAAHHVTTVKLRRLNGLSPNARVQPGQILALPRTPASGPPPSASPINKNGYTFQRDHIERTTRVTGGLTLARTGGRSGTNQRAAGGSDRRADDDGGHFIARRFNGPSDKFNHFAHNRNFNRGDYRVMEDGWARQVRAGHRVSVSISASYTGSSRRPDRIKVIWAVNGHQYRREFQNRRQEKTRGH